MPDVDAMTWHSPLGVCGCGVLFCFRFSLRACVRVQAGMGDAITVGGEGTQVLRFELRCS